MTDENIKKVVKAVYETALAQSFVYELLFNRKPCYIKIPLWVFEELYKFRAEIIGNIPAETLCGLKLCPTMSIKEISEIEVF